MTTPPRLPKFKDRLRARRVEWETRMASGGGSTPTSSRYFASTTMYRDILKTLAEGFGEQNNILSRYVRSNAGTTHSELTEKTQRMTSLLQQAGAGQAWLVNRMAQDSFKYTTQISVGVLSSAAGSYGNALSSYLGTKERLKFEYGDAMANGLKGGISLTSSIMYERAAQMAAGALFTEGVSLVPAALTALSGAALQLIATPLADKYGRKWGSELGESAAATYAATALASSLTDPSKILQYTDSYVPIATGLREYDGSDEFITAYLNNDYLNDGMSLKEMGVDRFEAAASISSLSGTLVDMNKGSYMPLAQRAHALSKTYSVDISQVGNIYSNIQLSYPGGQGRKESDARLVTARMEYLMTQVLGGRQWSTLGFKLAEQLSSAAGEMSKNTLGGMKGDSVILYGAVQDYSAKNINRAGEADTSNTTGIVGIVDNIMKTGATLRNQGGIEILQNIGVGVRDGFNGVAGDGKKFNDVISYSVSKVGLKKGDITLKTDSKGKLTGGIEVKDETQYRTIMGWLQDDISGLNLSDGDAQLYLQYMASFANKGEVDFKSAADKAKKLERQSIEAKTSHIVFRESLNQIVINRAKATNTMFDLNRSLSQELIQLGELTKDYFDKHGKSFAEAFKKSVEKVLDDAGSGIAWDKSTPTNDSVVNDFAGIYGDIKVGAVYGLTDKVRVSSYGYGKYASKFNGNFLNKVEDVAARLKIDPNWLMAIMSFETGGSFDPGQKGDGKHWGLIQFSNDRIAGFGMSVGKFTSLSQEQQMEYVYKYFEPYAGKIKSAGDLYSLVALPVTFGKDDSYLIDTDPRFPYLKNVAASNPKWDMNKDGHVSAGELRRVLYNDEYSKGFLFEDTNAANINFDAPPTQDPKTVGSLTAGNHIAARLKVPMSRESTGIGLHIAAAARAKLVYDGASWYAACVKFARLVFEKAMGRSGLGTGGAGLFRLYAYDMPNEWSKRRLTLSPQQVIDSGGFQPGDLIMSAYKEGHVAIVDVDGTIIQAGFGGDGKDYKIRTTLGEQFVAGTWTVGRISLDKDGDLRGDIDPQVYVKDRSAKGKEKISMEQAAKLVSSMNKDMMVTWERSPDGKGYVIVLKYKTSNGYKVVRDNAQVERVRGMMVGATGLNIVANNANVLKIKVNVPGTNKAGAAAQTARNLAPNTR